MPLGYCITEVHLRGTSIWYVNQWLHGSLPAPLVSSVLGFLMVWGLGLGVWGFRLGCVRHAQIAIAMAMLHSIRHHAAASGQSAMEA